MILFQLQFCCRNSSRAACGGNLLIISPMKTNVHQTALQLPGALTSSNDTTAVSPDRKQERSHHDLPQ